MPYTSYAAVEPGSALVARPLDMPALQPHDVEIHVTHCGICHSDLHLIDNDWRFSEYPLVPGHEVVGEVMAMGSAVSHLQIGDRVGIGWQAGSCMACEWCGKGYENHCRDSVATCAGRPGGFAERMTVDGRFAFRIPDALSSAGAAPLLCGGITVYNPLVEYNIRPEMKVGVIGIGGLGHLALKFANAFGCEVTAFSSTPDKEAEARRLGAHHFVASTDSNALKAVRGSLDFILSTVFVNLDWRRYLAALRPLGKLCVLGAPREPMEVPGFALLNGQKSVSGSAIGGRPAIQSMLAFAARHGIEAQVEEAPMADVNAALDRLRANAVRYRMVLLAE